MYTYGTYIKIKTRKGKICNETYCCALAVYYYIIVQNNIAVQYNFCIKSFVNINAYVKVKGYRIST